MSTNQSSSNNLKRGLYEVWGQGLTYPEVKEKVKEFCKENNDLYQQCARDSFKFNVEAYGRKLTREQQKEVRSLVNFYLLIRKEMILFFLIFKGMC